VLLLTIPLGIGEWFLLNILLDYIERLWGETGVVVLILTLFPLSIVGIIYALKKIYKSGYQDFRDDIARRDK